MRAWNLALVGAAVGCGDKDPSASNEDAVVVLGDTGLFDVDGDGYTAAEDCDDEDASVHPGAEELCDGVDNDCDDEVDEDATAWYADADGDGYGDPDDVVVDCAEPSGYVDNDLDCDDTRDDVNPNFPEICNGIDDDCDGVVDGADADGAVPWYADADGDGYGDADDVVIACDAPSGYCADDTDCDDTSAAASPGGTEVCDGLDNDCDGTVDGPDAADAMDWYADADGDGFGDAASSTRDCTAPSGHVADATDCDDTTALAYPGADERCDGIDNDCEGDVDEPDAIDASTWYADDDGDGFGDAADATVACTAPSGTVSDATDCDDTDASENPDADEICDGDDDDCDGVVDESDAIDAATWYADSDGDGYGDAGGTTVACDEPSGYVSDDTDCDDADAGANPGEDEVCDGDDDDCDGVVDEPEAVDAGTWYTDGDGDGYGDEGSGVTDCTQPSGTISTGGDCLDTDDTVYPGATEVCGDGVVNDCDSSESAADAACDDWGSTVSTGDAGAVFTATTTNWFMGINPAPVGDVDGDGIADVLLGSSLGSPGGVSEAGSTHLFHGPVSGTLPLSTADVIVAGRRSYDNAASSGAGLGDLDGDGYADILIGGPGSDEGATGSGTAWLLHGPVTSTSVTAYDLRLTSGTRYAQLGPARAPAGDQDGDGVGDLLIGAAFHGTYEGAAYVVPGDLTGARGIASAAIARIDGDVASDFLGRRVEGATDLDGDGQDDIVVGCQDCGTHDASAAYVFFGPVTGTLATGDADVHVTTGNNDDLSAGISAGDLDGDGQDDLALGAPNASPSSVRAGSIFVWAGPLSGGTLGATDAVGRVDGTGTNDRVGGSVDVATLDDDGAQDLLFASGFMNVTTSAIGYGEGTGEAWAMFGPISGSLDVTDAEHRFEGPDQWFGTGGITGVGDMTGDGRDEVLITSGYIAKSAWLFVAPGY